VYGLYSFRPVAFVIARPHVVGRLALIFYNYKYHFLRCLSQVSKTFHVIADHSVATIRGGVSVPTKATNSSDNVEPHAANQTRGSD
jgi:hypothetical protein